MSKYFILGQIAALEIMLAQIKPSRCESKSITKYFARLSLMAEIDELKDKARRMII